MLCDSWVVICVKNGEVAFEIKSPKAAAFIEKYGNEKQVPDRHVVMTTHDWLCALNRSIEITNKVAKMSIDNQS